MQARTKLGGGDSKQGLNCFLALTQRATKSWGQMWSQQQQQRLLKDHKVTSIRSEHQECQLPGCRVQGKVFLVQLSTCDRGQSQDGIQCPAQRLPARLHHSVLVDAKISNSNKSGTKEEALQKYPNLKRGERRKNHRAGRARALGQAWTHSGSTYVNSVTQY